jgi:uncharacterized membrane protein YeaQ/YmgE (transglycosylase-associated protein family)
MEDLNAGWVAAILMGGFIGWLTEKYMGSRMGMLVNIAIGVIGAVVASALLEWFGATWAGWIGYLVGGFAGAGVLISVTRMIKGF